VVLPEPQAGLELPEEMERTALRLTAEVVGADLAQNQPLVVSTVVQEDPGEAAVVVEAHVMVAPRVRAVEVEMGGFMSGLGKSHRKRRGYARIPSRY